MEKQIISVLCLCRERGQCCKKKNGSGSEGCQCVHRFLSSGSGHEKDEGGFIQTVQTQPNMQYRDSIQDLKL